MSDRLAESGRSLPEGWHSLSIDEIKSDTTYACVGGPFGSNLTTKDYVESPGIPVIRGTNLSEGSGRFNDDGFVFVTERKAATLTQNMAFPGDLIFTQRGTLGQIGHIPRNARFNRYVVSQSQMKLTPNERIADVDYLYHYFSSPESIRSIENTVEATGVPHINLGILKRLAVTLPPLPQQRKIARILTTVDNLIEKTEALIAKYQAIKQGMMHDLFTRGVDEHGHLRSPHEEAPELYKQSELGWIPKEWAVCRVDEAGTVKLGRQRSPKHQSGRFTTPYLRVANVFDGWIDFTDILEMDFTPTERDTFSVLPGDIFLNEGQSLELVGRSAIYLGEPDRFCFQNTLIRFRAFPSNSPTYCRGIFKYWLDVGRFMTVARQTTSVAHLGADRLAKMFFPLPKPDEQARIALRLQSQERQSEGDEKFLANLSKIKTGLMQDLLTGKVRVKSNNTEGVAVHA